jgi:hypothetical protein
MGILEIPAGREFRRELFGIRADSAIPVLVQAAFLMCCGTFPAIRGQGIFSRAQGIYLKWAGNCLRIAPTPVPHGRSASISALPGGGWRGGLGHSSGHRHRLASPTPPAVGIFWRLNGVLVIDRSTLDEAEPYGECIGHAAGHYERWQEWQALGTTRLAVAGYPDRIA